MTSSHHLWDSKLPSNLQNPKNAANHHFHSIGLIFMNMNQYIALKLLFSWFLLQLFFSVTLLCVIFDIIFVFHIPLVTINFPSFSTFAFSCHRFWSWSSIKYTYLIKSNSQSKHHPKSSKRSSNIFSWT